MAISLQPVPWPVLGVPDKTPPSHSFHQLSQAAGRQQPGQAGGNPCRRAVRCAASAAVPEGPSNTLLVRVVEKLFQFEPFFNMAAKNVSYARTASRVAGGNR